MRKNNLTKRVILISLILVVVGLAGCQPKINQAENAKDKINSKIEEGKNLINTGKEIAENGKGLVGGLKDAMKKGITMKCVADGADGHWVTYTNGKNFKTEGTTIDGKKMAMIKKDRIMYSWDEKTKKGYKIDQNCIEELQKSMGIDTSKMTQEQDNFDDFTPEKLEVKEKNGKLKCTPSTETDFSVPSDIEFFDQCKTMKEQMSGLSDQMDKIKQMQSKQK